MSTETRSKVLDIFKSIFSSKLDDDINEEELPPELKEALKELNTKEIGAEKAINQGGNSSSNNGGFSNKVNPITLEKMKKVHYENTERRAKNRGEKER